jgi:tetratricopeptide (TPR) repeat protein
MKLTKLRPLICLLALNLIVACSTFDRVALPTAKNMPGDGPAKNDETAPINQQELDPLVVKVQQLRAKPNLYQLNKVSVSSQVRQQFKHAITLKQQGEFDAAISEFEKLSTQYPRLSGTWLQLADLSLLQAKPSEQSRANEQAIALLEKAVNINPHNYFAHNRLGGLLRQQGQFAKADAHYQKAIASWPAFAQAYLNQGILFDLYIGDKQRALEKYQLYQALLEDSDRKVKGWIADLTRQIAAEQQEVAQQ